MEASGRGVFNSRSLFLKLPLTLLLLLLLLLQQLLLLLLLLLLPPPPLLQLLLLPLLLLLLLLLLRPIYTPDTYRFLLPTQVAAHASILYEALFNLELELL